MTIKKKQTGSLQDKQTERVKFKSRRSAYEDQLEAEINRPDPADGKDVLNSKADKGEIRKWLIKYSVSIALMVGIVYFTFSILMKQYSWQEIRESLSQTRWSYMVFAFSLIVLHEVCLASNLQYLLNLFIGQKIPFGLALQTVIVGFYFNNITPSASGGQPMEVYFLHRRGVKVAHSSLVFITMSFFFYLSMFFYTGLTFIVDGDVVMASLGDKKMMVLFLAGLIFNFFVAVFCYLICYKPARLRVVVKFLMSILVSLKLVKNSAKNLRKVARFLRSYSHGSQQIIGNRKAFFRLLTCCLIQVAALFTIPFAVSLALGAEPDWQFFRGIFGLQAVLYMATSAMPTPGAVGVTEGGFISMFSKILPATVVMPAMILTRVVNLYGFLIISALVTMWSFSISTRKKPLFAD